MQPGLLTQRCGGLWCPTDGGGTLCICGDLDSAAHRYYECPLLKNSADEIVKDTQWLVDKWIAKSDTSHHSCLWFRGILPASLVDLDADHADADILCRVSPNMPRVLSASRRVYTDGSGEPQWCPDAAKRCGCGWAPLTAKQRGSQKEDFEVHEVAHAASSVPGTQTVPNAEAWAAACAVAVLLSRVRCALLSDATYVVNGMNAEDRSRLVGGQHAASWLKLYKAIDARSEPIDVVRVPAHRTAQQVIDGTIPLCEFVGNTLADGVAATGAVNKLSRRAPVPEWVELNCSMAYSTLKRIAAIEEARWGQGHRLVPEPPPLPEHAGIVQSTCMIHFCEAVAARDHVLVAQGLWIYCTVCHRRCLSKHYVRWTRNDCSTGARAAPATEALSGKRFVPAAASDGQPMCTVGEMRRLTAAQRVEHMRRQASDEVYRKDVWRNAHVAVPFLTWLQLRTVTGTPPVAAHPSHVLIACGG